MPVCHMLHRVEQGDDSMGNMETDVTDDMPSFHNILSSSTKGFRNVFRDDGQGWNHSNQDYILPFESDLSWNVHENKIN